MIERDEADFNSFMVRLKVVIKLSIALPTNISIPSWCD